MTGGARARAVTAAIAIASMVACGTARPPGQGEAALYEDARRLVESEEVTGWIVDRVAYESLANPILQSACQVPSPDRARLLDWLAEAIIAAGGPAADAYARAGDDKGAVSEILTLERVRGLLAYAERRVDDECPFWLGVDEDFAGVQSGAGRVALLLESRGSLGVSLSGGDAGLGGGGQGRLKVGYGFSHDLTVLVGAELGGAALFQPQDDGASRELQGSLVGATPIVWRFHDGASVWDVELGLTGIYRDGPDTLSLGGRAAVAYGFSSTRVGAFLPVAVLWVGYEIYPAQHGEPAYHFIGIGTRVGVDIDL